MPKLAHQFEPSAHTFAPGRSFTTAAIAMSLLSTLTGVSSAATVAAPPITVNGSHAAVRGVETNNITFVPIRGVFEQIGTTVKFKAPASVVATQKGAVIARMTVGSQDANLKGSAVKLATAPFVMHGEVMVPLRAISETAGAAVSYSATAHRVYVTGSTGASAAADKRADATAAGAATTGAAAGAVAATSATATDATAAATAVPVADAQTDQGGIPWWVWLLVALVIGAIIFAFVRRKEEPVITTTSAPRERETVIKTRR
jgi:hypothetical protein